jgi:hypothetical protein
MEHIVNLIETVLVSPVLLYRYLRYGYTYRRIYLGEGQYTKLDSADYYRLRKYHWFLYGNNGKFYVCRSRRKGKRTNLISMHREIMNAPKNKLVDHRNSDPQDNRRENLHLATSKENNRNRCKMRKKTSSKYIGVSFRKREKKWRALICRNRKNISLGSFENEIDAAKAYDKAARKYFGEFARLNFPDPPDKWPGLEYYIAKIRPRLRSWFERIIRPIRQL